MSPRITKTHCGVCGGDTRYEPRTIKDNLGRVLYETVFDICDKCGLEWETVLVHDPEAVDLANKILNQRQKPN